MAFDDEDKIRVKNFYDSIGYRDMMPKYTSESFLEKVAASC